MQSETSRTNLIKNTRCTVIIVRILLLYIDNVDTSRLNVSFCNFSSNCGSAFIQFSLAAERETFKKIGQKLTFVIDQSFNQSISYVFDFIFDDYSKLEVVILDI